MTRKDVVNLVLGVVTFGAAVTASIATSGVFAPAVVAVVAGINAGLGALGVFISSRMSE